MPAGAELVAARQGVDGHLMTVDYRDETGVHVLATKHPWRRPDLSADTAGQPYGESVIARGVGSPGSALRRTGEASRSNQEDAW